MSKLPSITFIVPAYNEERLIDATLTKLAAFITANKDFFGSYEVIVGATGTDATAVLARAHASKFEHLHVFEHKNIGKGDDVRAAFSRAQGDIQLFFDADLATPLPHVIDMVKKLRDGADVVIGVRSLTKIHPGFFRSLLSVGANMLTRPLLPTIKDTQCGFKGFTREAAQTLFAQQKVKGWGFDIELLVHARQAKLKVVQMPIKDWYESREEHLVGQNPLKVALRTLREVGKIYAATIGSWLERRSGFVAACAAIATGLAAWWIGPDRSIWFDEGYTLALIKEPIDRLIHFTAVDVHPPLYYLSLKGWLYVVGSTDIALRTFSIICGALASGVALITVRRFFSARIMLAAVPFLVLAPFLLRYDIEARMYAMASLIGIVATYVLVCALQQKQQAKKVALWFVYGLLVLAGMYTLFYTALIWIVHFAWCIYQQGRPRTFWKLVKQPWIVAYAGAFVFFVPWLLISFDRLRNSGLWVGSPAYKEVANVFSLAFGWTPEWQLGPWGSLLILGAVGAAISLVVIAFRHVSAKQRPYLVLFLVYAVLPFVILYLASLPPSKPAFLYRYFAHTLIGMYALVGIAAGLAWKTSKYAKFAAIFIVGVLAYGVVTLHQVGNYNLDSLRRPGAKDIAAFLQTQDTTNSIFVTDNAGLYYEMVQYLDSPKLYFYDGDKSVGPHGGLAILENSMQQIREPLRLNRPIYYVLYDPKPTMPFVDGATIETVYTSDVYRLLLVTPPSQH